MPHGAAGGLSGVVDDGEGSSQVMSPEHGAHVVGGGDEDGTECERSPPRDDVGAVAAGRRGRELTELEEMSPRTPQFPVHFIKKHLYFINLV